MRPSRSRRQADNRARLVLRRDGQHKASTSLQAGSPPGILPVDGSSQRDVPAAAAGDTRTPPGRPPAKREAASAAQTPSAADAASTVSAGGDADVGGGRPSQYVLHAQEQWLDLIADLIVQDLRDKEPRDADALRGVRQVQ